mgnify:CR=1 FL=1
MENKITLKNIICFVLVVAILLLAIYSIDILLLLFASFVITCAINPMINKLEAKMPRIWAVVLILLIMILASLVVLIPLISICIDETVSFVNNFPNLIDRFDEILNFKVFNQSISSYITFDSLKEPITQSSKFLIENSIMAGKGIAGFLTTFFAMAIIVFYFAYDEKRLTDKFIEFFPKKNKEKAKKILDSISQKVGNYVFAQGIAMVFVGVLTTIGLLFLKNDHAFLLGLITCLFDIIPVIGPTVAISIGLVTSISGGFACIILTFLVYIIAQWAQNQFLRPIVFGKLLNMHPLMIIIALLVGARFLGVWGVILAPAMASVVCILVDELYLDKINKK